MHLTFPDFIMQVFKMRTFLVAIVIALVLANGLSYSVPDEIDMENDLDLLDSDAYQDRDTEDQQNNDPEDYQGRSQITRNREVQSLVSLYFATLDFKFFLVVVRD